MGDVDAFVAYMRHELGSPITAILGYSELLLEGGGRASLRVAERDGVERVADSGKHLVRIIRDIVDPAGGADGSKEYALRLRNATRPPLTEVRGCIKSLLEEHEHAPVGDDLRRINVATVRLSGLIDSVEHTFRVRVAETVDAPQLLSATVEAINATGDAGSGGGSILVIDDEEANRALLARRLTRQGYSVLFAETGEAGFAIAAREPVDVILLDVLLPGMSGYEVLTRLKSDDAL